jgi:hypothetical protein
MKKLRAALHAVRAVGVIYRKILRQCRKMAGGKLPPAPWERSIVLACATHAERTELNELDDKRDDLIAAVFALLPSEDELRSQDGEAAAAVIWTG